MSRLNYTITNIEDDDADIWANDFDVAAGTTATLLTGHTDGLGHLISVTPSASLQSTIFTFVGTDANARAQTEVLTVAGTSLVPTVKYYRTLTAVTIDAVNADAVTVDIGITDDAVSKFIPLDWRSDSQAAIAVEQVGTSANWDIQETYSPVLDIGKEGGLSTSSTQDAIVWTDITALAAKATDTDGKATLGVTAVRFLLNSTGTSTDDMIIRIQQSSKS